MNKVFVLPPYENWIVDRFVKEWNQDNIDISTSDPQRADVIWLLADWAWDKLSSFDLSKKKVLTTIHHIVPEKFDSYAISNFLKRDSITTAYHVYNEQTKNFIKKYTQKEIHVIQYWANQKIWFPTQQKNELRKKYNIPIDGYIIGSFQRDTEGKDLRSPKLEKGPDLLADYLEKIYQKERKLHVILAGWRRQYIVERLKNANIPFSYFELPPHNVINDLYQTLDLYPVSSRCEGGPQSLIECGLLNVPVITRDVGIARQVLPDSSINNNLLLAKPSVPVITAMKLPEGYAKYRELLLNL